MSFRHSFHLADDVRCAIEEAIFRAARKKECTNLLTICLLRPNGLIITLRSMMDANDLDSGTALLRASVALDVARGETAWSSVKRHADRISRLFSPVHICAMDSGNIAGTAVFRMSENATILAALSVVAPTPELAREFAEAGVAAFRKRMRTRSDVAVAEEVS